MTGEPIVLVYTSIDRCYKRRSFKTLDGAKKFAWNYVGPHPSVSNTFGYAVSDDGIGKIEIRSGTTFALLFPERA